MKLRPQPKFADGEGAFACGTVVLSTERAIWLHLGDRKVWLPKSQVEIEPRFYRKNDEVVVTMPEWLARRLELIK